MALRAVLTLTTVLQPGFKMGRVLKRKGHYEARFSKIGRVLVSFITV